ncbi:porphobilinogen synthase, partial [candidate division KSB1 bacterium]|nr:porphobilinogen synthase [candidate division KSB1 bacterium]
GQLRFTVDMLVEECKAVEQLGIPAVILFGIPAKKDPKGTGGYAKNGIVQKALRAVKKECKSLALITDVCMCAYTDHGHCGVIVDGDVDNDLTLELLGKTALSHVEAVADMVAPSDMMDGRIGYIRDLLDLDGHSDIPIMAYSAKFSSAFFGPFREAADSAPQYGDRKTYQMDPPNIEEALREIALDIDEGADIVMVKPALPYLDVISRVKQEFSIPIAAYNVSGEYAMIKAAAKNGWIDEERVIMETLVSIKRAGADLILTYFAKDAARIIS